ncbi:MAG: hypothetical protein ACJA2S_003937, partial [Cyclobacteriaceae bacterium]
MRRRIKYGLLVALLIASIGIFSFSPTTDRYFEIA